LVSGSEVQFKKVKDMIKLYGSFLIILFFCAILLLSCGSNQENNSKNDSLQDIQDKKVAEIRTTLIDRYKPIVFPLTMFREKQIFTYSLVHSLIEPEKPVLFSGYLDDITKVGDIFYVRFITAPTDDPVMDDRRIIIQLRCEYEDVKSLVENPPDWDDGYKKMFLEYNFGVVFKAITVNKILKFDFIEHRGDNSVDVEAEMEIPDVFIVKGELIEMQKY
jgi:hypothetical protein